MHLLQNKLECGYGGVIINKHNLIIIKVVFKSRKVIERLPFVSNKLPIALCLCEKADHGFGMIVSTCLVSCALN